MAANRSSNGSYQVAGSRTDRLGGVVAILLWALCCTPNIGHAYSGGSGTLHAPYSIATPEDLIALSRSPRDYDRHFLLTEDIDLAGHTFSRALIGSSEPPTGTSLGGVFQTLYPSFNGTINGNGHVISNLTITGIAGYSNVGLIGALGPSGRVYGLGLIDVAIEGRDENVGMFVGKSEGILACCYASGVVRGVKAVGGLVGANSGYLENCYCWGEVSGTEVVGGLVGRGKYRLPNWIDTMIVNSYSACQVQVTDHIVSGISGFGGIVSGCFWDTQVSGSVDPNPGSDAIGLDTASMQDIRHYLEAGWDFSGEQDNGCCDVWSMPETGGYPVLTVFQEPVSIANSCLGGRCCPVLADVNDVFWDASSYFQPAWHTVSIAETLARSGEPFPGRVVTIRGEVGMLRSENLIGVDFENARVCQALDAEARPVPMFGSIRSLIEPKHSWDMLNHTTRPLTLVLPLDETGVHPDSLSQVDFVAYALTCQLWKTVEIPFAAMDDWLEIVPRLRMRIENHTTQGGSKEYRITEEYSLPSSRVQEVLMNENTLAVDQFGAAASLSELEMIYGFALLDASGNPATHGGRRGSGWSGGAATGTRTRSGDWAYTSHIVSVRYTVAVKPRILKVPLTLSNIPLLSH